MAGPPQAVGDAQALELGEGLEERAASSCEGGSGRSSMWGPRLWEFVRWVVVGPPQDAFVRRHR